jgi:hypothetical protein
VLFDFAIRAERLRMVRVDLVMVSMVSVSFVFSVSWCCRRGERLLTRRSSQKSGHYCRGCSGVQRALFLAALRVSLHHLGAIVPTHQQLRSERFQILPCRR